jgi:AraC family transcriptional regulator, regulatory protein of adaptative response / methylated-DNA-[protein]-cysteine methyltransferase
MKIASAELSRRKRVRDMTRDPRWTAVVERSAAADGTFVFAVRTTGVFCRPSCSARRPRPENVEFYADAKQAERAGYRACKRCTPDRESPSRRQSQLVARLCRQIERAERAPSLRELSAMAGLSPFHLQRLFRAVTGTTPRAFAAAHRAERARRELGRGASVTKAIYAAGYSSTGRFYAETDARLGMRPKRYQARGAGEVIEFAVGRSSLGAVLVAATERGVCAILLGDTATALTRDLRQLFSRAQCEPGGHVFTKTVAAVVGLIEEPAASVDLPIDIRGTAFQQRVWQALRAIPAGQTICYAELARRVGVANGSRAVARACASNALAVVVPCHRVIRGDGDLAGYRWGVERKRRLLEREAQQSS